MRRRREDGPDVFAVHRIDEQLAKAMDRKVWLPSGGTLVIDRTEAMTIVDVNTGKFTGSGGNLEQTVTKNNLEAAEETVRQLRLRDIGGIIVIDFIDMVLESNRDLVLRRLTEALARDRTRHQVSEVTSLGLVQLTRKKLGTGLIEAFSTTCPHCSGRGIMLHGDPVDSAPATGRKSESGGRRGRRSKKGKAEERGRRRHRARARARRASDVQGHGRGQRCGHHDDDESAHGDDAENVPADQNEDDAEADAQLHKQVAKETAEEDLEDEDFDDTEDDDDSDDDDSDDDTDDDDTEQVDLDDDDDDLDDEDDLEDEDDDDERRRLRRQRRGRRRLR